MNTKTTAQALGPMLPRRSIKIGTKIVTVRGQARWNGSAWVYGC
jgi:hypothetical protein